MKRSIQLLAAGLILGGSLLHAQSAPVTAHPNPEALFTSTDPKLHANKQVAYKIVKELLESGHWDRSPQYLTKEYIQHNPVAASGLQAVMDYFINVAKAKPKPIPEKMQTKVVSVVAEGDLVVVSFVREMKDPKDASRTYTTTWFDMWRFRDGKADEHWDPMTLPAAK